MQGLVRRAAILASFVLLLGAASSAYQIQYARGQSVVPVFEGWQRDPDGSFAMWFGYMNRNYEEELNIPVGPNNSVEPNGPDRGQPGYFYPRRGPYRFKVNVPSDWPKDHDVVWTLVAHGRTEKAYGTLQPVWEIDDGVIMSNYGGGGNVFVTGDPNAAPKITAAPRDQTITTGMPVSLMIAATDDGWPQSRNLTKRESMGLKVTWAEFRGPGSVTFPTGRVAKLVDGRATVAAKFSEPGIYRLRAHVDDFGLFALHDVTITVSPASSSRTLNGSADRDVQSPR